MALFVCAPDLVAAQGPPLTGDKAIEHLKATGQYESLAAAITGARYAVTPVETTFPNLQSRFEDPPGEGTGPTGQTDAGGNLVGRVPSRGGVSAYASPENRKLTTENSSVWAQNPAHGLNSVFSPEGLTFTVRSAGCQPAVSPVANRQGGGTIGAPECAGAAQAGSPAKRQTGSLRYETDGETTYTVGWRLRSVGYGAAQTPVQAGMLRTAGQRVELTRTVPAVTEWFVNGPAGLEHGFTLPERPFLGSPHANIGADRDDEQGTPGRGTRPTGCRPGAPTGRFLGSTGDSPVPPGDPPDGTGAKSRTETGVGFSPRTPAIPVGGSPTGSGESPEPPNSTTRSEPLWLVMVVIGDLTPHMDGSAVTQAQSPPAIASVSPAAASVGSTVTLTGSNFSATPANNSVYFGGVRTTVTAATGTLRDSHQHSLS